MAKIMSELVRSSARILVILDSVCPPPIVVGLEEEDDEDRDEPEGLGVLGLEGGREEDDEDDASEETPKMSCKRVAISEASA